MAGVGEAVANIEQVSTSAIARAGNGGVFVKNSGGDSTASAGASSPKLIIQVCYATSSYLDVCHGTLRGRLPA